MKKNEDNVIEKKEEIDNTTKAFLEELERDKMSGKEKAHEKEKGDSNETAQVPKKKKKKSKKLPIFLFIVVVLLSAGGFIVYTMVSDTELQAAPEIINPLTGEVVTEPLPPRPIVVSNDNAEGARPQSGITRADIVYEFPAEGFIPRLQPIFYSDLPERVAPVRSVRNCFLDMAREFKAIHVGYGSSPQAADYMATGKVLFVNANVGDDIYWRGPERPAGVHNVYVNLNDVAALEKTDDWNSPQIIRSYPRYGTDLSEEEQLAEDELLSKFPSATSIEMAYTSEEIEYKYDEKTKLYTRYVDGEVAVDFEDNTPVTTANIIVQHVDIGFLDSTRLDLDMTGGGECIVFTKGKAFVGEWSRENLEAPTIFYMMTKDENGETVKEEIKLSVGKTWIQILETGYEVKYQ